LRGCTWLRCLRSRRGSLRHDPHRRK
jgi:hypothetical protein